MSAEHVPVDSGHDPILSRLEHARRDLLDLGLRNSLINYRPLKSRGVEAVGESPIEVFRILVRDGKRMTFAPAPEKTTPQATTQATHQPTARQANLLPDATQTALLPDEPPALSQPEEPSPAEIAARQRDSQLQTAVSSEQLQTRLLNTYYAARTFIEEQGVNILFLALGMLEWYEADASEEKRRAPLLLVPVDLERSNALDRFHLSYGGEDIGDNLSLAAKLKTEFGVEAPTMPDIEDLDLGAWFDAWEQAIESRQRWAIDRTAVALGFFSFGKFLMYRDLDPTTWPDGAKPTQHPIVSSLLTQDGFREPPSPIADDAFLDQFIQPAEVNQVVDADSSQTLAILDVNAGRNLVIQGPPGTGKSQTITNMIAEAIGAGRSVLFVAEKMAALEVVKRRLDRVGLGEACLELHSHKMNKRSVLADLRRTLELGKPKVEELRAELDLLESSRARLNAYCDAVNSPIGNSTVTPHVAYGALIRSRSIPASDAWPKLEIPAMAQWTESEFNRRLAIAQELQARLSAMGVPSDHPFWGSRLAVLLPSSLDRLKHELTIAAPELDATKVASRQLAYLLGMPSPENRPDTLRTLVAAERVLEAPDLTGVNVAADEWRTQSAAILEWLEAGTAEAAIRERRAGTLIPEGWEADLLPVRQVLAANKDKLFRFLSGEYRGAKATLAGYCASGLPDGADAQIALIDDVLEARRQRATIEQHAQLGQTVFGQPGRDWDRLSRIADWLIALHADVAAGTVPPETITYLAGGPDATAIRQAVEQVRQTQSAWGQRLAAIESLLEFDDTRRFGDGSRLADQSWTSLSDLLNTWLRRLDDLDQMVAFNQSAAVCEREGIDDVIRVAERWKDGANHLTDAFRRGRYAVLLEQALRERPELATFDAAAHEQVIQRFRELDQLVFAYNRSRLALEHWQRLPQHEAGGQLGVLRREFEKKSRHLPVRQLIARAGNAVQAIKPVFMMSPLSIATYIPPGTLTFDLVVFDEASQVKPVDAFGALARGKQAVVVGDSRQLPPTSFFDALTQGEEPDAEDTTADIESILGLFSAQSAPQRMLRWHYRSRHESLIAVSNHEFYENRLVVFPSPDHARSEAGLIFRHLPDTAYDRGGSRTNRDEARVVAEAVMRHARDYPHLTLGVAAFSNPQAEAILAEVERLRRDDPTCEEFFSSHPHEPFFVKNLENVQGDERDVIFISVGYGRTAEGYVAMNFGPLNADGGERRLNVLITRSRLRCEVFTNLTSDDIDLNRSQARGVAAFKRFLKFAETGIMDVPQASDREADSPFETAVAEALRQAGYVVESQVGSAGFFIDLAVVDPQKPGRYLLGIECDGASYHSARSARDRDRLRQQVLEGLGWTIYRIWSTDWFRNADRELRRVINAIEAAAARGDTTEIPVAAAIETTIEREDENDTPAASGQPAYVVAQPSIQTGGLDLHAVSVERLASWIAEVVSIESPVHADDAIRRIAEGAGISRIGGRLRAALESAITHAAIAGQIEQRGPFLWQPGMYEPPLRDRSNRYGRSLASIAPEEIAVAIRTAVVNAYGIDQAQLPAAACRLLGFSRLTEDMRSTLDQLIEAMIASGHLQRQGTHVTGT